ncbi:FAD-dependent oxidoreductase [Solicola gregarius]|uniref:NAD(P)/FAD-dependent oxidoreductase n=1 Tax=Solicola gregarius TaxID=2908642 RepID=A0AA46TKW4_9ACTN|nr:FAD-dependent oxidoreductase [Solicola gregarius]UYM07194.1 NAD(P)/FAD-dependent oxidoreductase [Solicola gregarius]
MESSRTADVVVIGAGQAGLSAAYHLRRRGLEPYEGFVVLDANAHPGGAWQHRWRSLTMRDVHGVAALPGTDAPHPSDADRANRAVPAYFADYERSLALPVLRPVRVGRVTDGPGAALTVHTDVGNWVARAIVNATGTWGQPFVPHYPGADEFRGRQLHTVEYDGPGEFAGQRVLVVGGGASAVQILAELAPYAETTWATRRPPVWRDGPFGPEDGRAAVALVEERVRQGLPPQSVVSVTGLMLREQEKDAAAAGVYERLPMFARLTTDGAVWPDGRPERFDAVLWATGFRPDVAHLAPLHLREPTGGIALDGTEAVRDPRIQLVGYGPSASTIGANRAGRVAARNVLRRLEPAAA